MWQEVGHWERGGTLVVAESVGADRPGRKGIRSAITFFLKQQQNNTREIQVLSKNSLLWFRFEFVALLHLQVRLGPWELELCHTAHSNSDLVL